MDGQVSSKMSILYLKNRPPEIVCIQEGKVMVVHSIHSEFSELIDIYKVCLLKGYDKIIGRMSNQNRYIEYIHYQTTQIVELKKDNEMLKSFYEHFHAFGNL